MANEAVILELNEHMDAMQYTCAAGTSISKGTLLKLSGDNTVIASGDGDTGPYAGVAAADKSATNDTSTKIAVYTPGQGNKFDMKTTPSAITNGALVSLSGTNLIKQATATDVENGYIVGKIMEAATAAEVAVVLS